MDISPRPSPARWIIAGGLLVGTLDLLFAGGFWAMRNVPPIRIAQSIAAGVLGDASYDGGAASAWLGVVLHYFIAMMFVLVYWLMARRAAALLQRPVRYGLLYGLLLYLVMNFVVLPLSAAGMPSFNDTSWLVASVAMHLLIGVLCARFARRAGM
jgi:uncharacterized membrane protein YagU involved in acid resistance